MIRTYSVNGTEWIIDLARIDCVITREFLSHGHTTVYFSGGTQITVPHAIGRTIADHWAGYKNHVIVEGVPL